MRKAAIALAILVALVLAGLALAPQFVDLNRLKGPITTELAAITGRTVELKGPLGLSLLPGPTVTARDVRLANPPGAAVQDMVRLRAVEVKLAFWPLLARRVEIRSATLVEPDLDLERLASGDGNWRLEAAARGTAAAEAGTMMRALAVDHVTIENGAVTYRSGNSVERFEHINAAVEIAGPRGPYTARGEFVSHGAQLGFEARSGALDATEMPLQIILSARPATRLQLDLVASGAGEQRRIEGRVKLTADNPQTLAAMALRARLPPALTQPVALSADLSATPHDLALEHVSLDFGAAHGEGSLRVRPGTPPRIGLSLSVNQLDLDRWLAPRKAAIVPIGLIASAFAASADGRPSTVVPAAPLEPGALILPEAVDLSVDLSVKALIWRNGVVRNAQLKATLANGRLALDRAAALLPGGSDLSLSGSAAMSGEGLRGQGVVEANSDDLRGILSWLGAPSGSVPADRLRKASLTSQFALAGDRLELSGIDVTLDATRLSGAATIVLRERPGVGLRLAADRFNLDAYLPRADASSPSTPPAAGSPWLALLAMFDANVDAHVNTVTWHGEPLSDAHFAGTVQNGAATIRDLSIGDAGGAAARFSGTLQGLAGAPFAAQLSYEVHGTEFERLLHVLSPPLGSGRDLGAFQLGGELHCAADNISGTAELGILGGRAHLAGALTPAEGRVAVDIEVEHPSFAGLMRGLTARYRPMSDPGPLKVTGRLTGMAGHVSVDRFALDIGQATATGTLAVDLDPARPHVAADVKIGDWAIDRLLTARQSAAIEEGMRRAGLISGVILVQAGAGVPASAHWSREPIDLAVLSLADADLTLAGGSIAYGPWRLDQPALTATLKDGRLAVKQLGGRLFDGSVEASGDLAAAATPAFQAKIKLVDTDLKQALTSIAGVGTIEGRLDVDAQLSGEGGSAEDMIRHLSGEATLRVHGGSLSGIDLAAASDRLKAHDRQADLADLLRRGAGGRTNFSELAGSFRVADGVARSDDLHLAADGAAGHATATVDLPRSTMAGRIELRLTGLAEAPPIAWQLDGPIDAPREVFDVNALEQFLSQRQGATDEPPVSRAEPR